MFYILGLAFEMLGNKDKCTRKDIGTLCDQGWISLFNPNITNDLPNQKPQKYRSIKTDFLPET